MHAVQIVFKDEKTLNINLEKEHVKQIMNAVELQKVFYVPGENEESGIYLNPREIRYIIFGELNENAENKEEEKQAE